MPLPYFSWLLRHKRFAVAVALAGGLLWFAPQLFGSGGDATTGASATGQDQMAPEVTVARPVSQNITEFDEFTGRFEPMEDVEIRARVGGYLESVHFKEGAIVTKGDLLFVIDPRPFEAERRQAEAELKAAQTRVELTQRELARAAQLIKTNAIAERVVDERKQEEQEARANVDAARARLEKAKLDVEFTRITAPVSGRISRKEVSEGNLITGGTADSTLLTTIVTLDPIHFNFDVDEQTYIKYARLAASGDRPSSRDNPNPVTVALADEKEFTHQGVMDFVDNRIDPQTGTMRGRAIFNNKSMLFTPGMFGRIRILGSGEYPALLVSDEAISTDQTRKFVYVVAEDGTVSTKAVVTGPIVNGLRVVRDGISAQDNIVINGLQRVRDGAKVKPVDGEMKPATVPDKAA